MSAPVIPCCDPGVMGRVYGLPVLEWRETGDSLLLHNGPGIAMAAMDACPRLRWALDLTGLRKPLPYGVASFCEAAARWCPKVACTLIFFADDPAPCRDLLARMLLQDGRLAVLTNRDLPGPQTPRFDDLVASVDSAPAR